MSYVSEVMADAPNVYYRTDEASGLIQDSSGNARHATSSEGAGSATYQEVGALASDTPSTSIEFTPPFFFTVPDHALLDLGDIFTLEAWVKRGRVGVDEYFLNKDNGAYSLRIETDNKLSLDQYSVGNITRSTITLTNDGLFHHLVVTKNGATLKVYVDAVDRTAAVTNRTCTNNADPLRLGSDGVSLPFQGWLDEIALYPTALTQARAEAHYNAASAEVPPFASVTIL